VGRREALGIFLVHSFFFQLIANKAAVRTRSKNDDAPDADGRGKFDEKVMRLGGQSFQISQSSATVTFVRLINKMFHEVIQYYNM
jgi:hypothetical protein